MLLSARNSCDVTTGITHLKRSIVDQNSVELLQRLGGTIGTAKDDGGDPTTGSVRAICELDTLDWSNRGMEVLLYTWKNPS